MKYKESDTFIIFVDVDGILKNTIRIFYEFLLSKLSRWVSYPVRPVICNFVPPNMSMLDPQSCQLKVKKIQKLEAISNGLAANTYF